ncbi:helix-turn-helix transcriptional regulator [Hyalangium versicolor]|uniref:helix-turn-helix transcriptional regulator n=1 Tax=Hyalangium versicolor TaxID=2861190 RepID=UPI001CCEE046|nr:helix-turn-helix transcriptional regulator [Hyalangium versicolor]
MACVSPPGKSRPHGPSAIQVPEDLAPIIKRERRRLGLRLRALRTARGLTQEQAAEMIGIHPKYMPRVEAGRANLTVDNLIAASVAYGVSLRDLFPEAYAEDATK